MKLDLIVYGRGQERSEGFQHFARPPYWTDDMLITMSRFNELWTGGDLKDTCPEAFAYDPNPWGKTYMFICQPPPYCCALLRCTRVEGSEPGTWLKEVRNYDIWSMEGLCCPYEQRENFFALIPSMILWFEQDNSSLYGRLRKKTIGGSFELPEELALNPYSESKEYPDIMYDIILSMSVQNAWIDLWDSVKFSSKPFHFIFGPLAENFAESIGDLYGIKEVYSTIYQIPRMISDPYEKMTAIEHRNPTKIINTYRLRLKLGANKNGGISRRWGIYDVNLPDTADDTLKSRKVDEGQTVDMIELLAEAEAVKNFVRQLNWTTAEQETADEQYTFKKEE